MQTDNTVVILNLFQVLNYFQHFKNKILKQVQDDAVGSTHVSEL